MNAPAPSPPPLPPRAPALSPEQTLRRLFLTLFLRGRGARGLKKEKAPKSVGSKLATTLVLYAVFGCMALVFMGQPVFALSVYLHAMTLMFVGMFVASSSGEVLFNKEEADILMHRPVAPRSLLWAKISVLVQVSSGSRARSISPVSSPESSPATAAGCSPWRTCSRRFSKRCSAPVASC